VDIIPVKLWASPSVHQLKNWPTQIDLPPENESSFMLGWKLREGVLNGQKALHSTINWNEARRITRAEMV